MEEVTRDLFVSITAFGSIFGILYVFLMTRHRERMSMLEKGLTPSAFASKTGVITLKLGMVLIGVALGILIGDVMQKNDWVDKPAVAYFSMIFLFGGISLVLNFIINVKTRN